MSTQPRARPVLLRRGQGRPDWSSVAGVDDGHLFWLRALLRARPLRHRSDAPRVARRARGGGVVRSARPQRRPAHRGARQGRGSARRPAADGVRGPRRARRARARRGVASALRGHPAPRAAGALARGVATHHGPARERGDDAARRGGAAAHPGHQCMHRRHVDARARHRRRRLGFDVSGQRPEHGLVVPAAHGPNRATRGPRREHDLPV